MRADGFPHGIHAVNMPAPGQSPGPPTTGIVGNEFITTETTVTYRNKEKNLSKKIEKFPSTENNNNNTSKMHYTNVSQITVKEDIPARATSVNIAYKNHSSKVLSFVADLSDADSSRQRDIMFTYHNNTLEQINPSQSSAAKQILGKAATNIKYRLANGEHLVLDKYPEIRGSTNSSNNIHFLVQSTKEDRSRRDDIFTRPDIRLDQSVHTEDKSWWGDNRDKFFNSMPGLDQNRSGVLTKSENIRTVVLPSVIDVNSISVQDLCTGMKSSQPDVINLMEKILAQIPPGLQPCTSIPVRMKNNKSLNETKPTSDVKYFTNNYQSRTMHLISDKTRISVNVTKNEIHVNTMGRLYSAANGVKSEKEEINTTEKKQFIYNGTYKEMKPNFKIINDKRDFNNIIQLKIQKMQIRNNANENGFSRPANINLSLHRKITTYTAPSTPKSPTPPVSLSHPIPVLHTRVPRPDQARRSVVVDVAPGETYLGEYACYSPVKLPG